MAISYVVVKREIHVGGNPGTKYLARLWREQDVNLETIADEISEASALSHADVVACLKAFEFFVSQHVMNGSAVKFQTLGSFVPSIKVKAMATKEAVTTNTIKRACCRFVPSVQFKHSLKKANYTLKDLTVTGLQG
jgi:predicted histone-like DNA-binding protein